MGRRKQNVNYGAEEMIIDDSVTEKIIAKDYDGLKNLISQGTSLDNRNSQNQLPIEVALINADFDAVIALLEGGANANSTNKLGLTFLHIAIRNIEKYIQSGYSQDVILSIIKKLIDAGITLNTQERRGNTPINFIAQLAKANKPLTEIYTKIGKLLLTLDKNVSATVQIKNNMGKSPMDYLSRNGNLVLKEAIYEKLPSVQNRITAQLKEKDLEIKKLMSLDKELVK
ncbi:MAG: hypothetical protein HRU36_02225 [Rickettsiales bacterium]|nr:hypothetical protein [Rickettsiales bacterium]